MNRRWAGLFGSFLIVSAFLSVALAQEKKEEAPEDPGMATLKLDGKSVKVTFGRPSTDGAGYKSMQKGVPDGYQWRMGRNEATQLDTEVDLKFGDKVIKAGSYGLWARRVGDAWHLVINSKVIMPTEQNANDTIVAVVPLKATKIEKPVKFMLIELKEDKATKGGVFRLAWGTEEGTAKFTVAK